MIRGEIWLVEFGIPYGSKAGYTRPVLIVQDDSFNESRIKTIIVLPITTNLNLLKAPGNVLLRKKESKLSSDSVILIPQFYALDRSRFKERISKVTKQTIDKVEIGMRLVLGMS